MKQIKLSTNFEVFLLFIGVAELKAFQAINWAKAALCISIGFVFLIGDNIKK